MSLVEADQVRRYRADFIEAVRRDDWGHATVCFNAVADIAIGLAETEGREWQEMDRRAQEGLARLDKAIGDVTEDER